MSEARGVALAIFGIVALIAIVGLVLLFSGRLTGKVTNPALYDQDKLYGGGSHGIEVPYTINRVVKGVRYTPEFQDVAETGGKRSLERIPSLTTKNCPPKLTYFGARSISAVGEDFGECIVADDGKGWCCPPPARLDPVG